MSKIDNLSIETVQGPVPLQDLNVTLTHEHLTIDFQKFYINPPNNAEEQLNSKIKLENFWFVQRYPYSNKYNLTLNDEDAQNAIIEDVKLFYESRGRTILDNSCYGLQRDIPFLQKVSKETNVNIILGTGYYIAKTQKASTLDMTVDQIYNKMKNDMENNFEKYPSIKAGFIGEVGSDWPIQEFEKKVIAATGMLQAELCCPVSFHPGRNPDAPAEILRLYQEAGGDISRAVMSHMERTITDRHDLETFVLDHKCYSQFDLFGTESAFYQLNSDVTMPSDAQRISLIEMLKEDKMLDRILVSHDIHTKHRLTRFGGHGYAHILNNILPIMHERGFTREEFKLLMVGNPLRWLTPS